MEVGLMRSGSAAHRLTASPGDVVNDLRDSSGVFWAWAGMVVKQAATTRTSRVCRMTACDSIDTVAGGGTEENSIRGEASVSPLNRVLIREGDGDHLPRF